MREVALRMGRTALGLLLGSVVVFWLVTWVAVAFGVGAGMARWLAWTAVAVLVFLRLAMTPGSSFNRESGVSGDPYGLRDWRRDPLNPRRR